MAKGRLGSEEDKADGGSKNPRTYKMEFSTRRGDRTCPVEGCSGRAWVQTSMRVHFWDRNVSDTVVIL